MSPTMKWMLPWLATAALCLAFLFGMVPTARSATLTATGSGLTWTATMPTGFRDAVLVIDCFDCDVRDEATLTVNGNALTLFGVDDTTRDQRVVEIRLPGVTLAEGVNTLVFACTRRVGCFRADAVRVEYAPAVIVEPWMNTARMLLATGWVPAWLTTDDEVWVVSREDVEPARVYACATDTATGARASVWLEGQLGALPDTGAPVPTACDMAWCFAAGPTRAADIRRECL